VFGSVILNLWCVCVGYGRRMKVIDQTVIYQVKYKYTPLKT